MSSLPVIQVWLVRTLAKATTVSDFMSTHWAWPAMESIHFIGLSLLVGTIVLFDLRLLGLARRIPIAALHKLIPWGIAGYCINLTSGLMFLMSAPDQYIYNPAFHFKILFMAIAGFNATAFYAVASQRTMGARAQPTVPRRARVVAAISIAMWIGVIVCGRLLTFYRPGPCPPEGPGLIARCNPRWH